jgi:hypothetical protein
MTNHLADCHLLDHISLSRSRCSTDSGRRSSLLLKYLPELQALISSYEVLVKFNCGAFI